MHAEKSAVSSLLNIGRDLIPTNIVAAAALPNYMGVITFAIVFACALSTYGILFVHLVLNCKLWLFFPFQYISALRDLKHLCSLEEGF